MTLGDWVKLWMWVYVVDVSLVYEPLTSSDFWFIIIYKIFMPKFFFFHNSGSNQNIFILFEDLSSMELEPLLRISNPIRKQHIEYNIFYIFFYIEQ